MTAATMIPPAVRKPRLLVQTFVVTGRSSRICPGTAGRARSERGDIVLAAARADTEASTDTIV